MQSSQSPVGSYPLIVLSSVCLTGFFLILLILYASN